MGAAERVTGPAQDTTLIGTGCTPRCFLQCYWNWIEISIADSAQLIRKPRSSFRFIFLVEELRIDLLLDLNMQLRVESEMLGECKVACDGASQTLQIAQWMLAPRKGPCPYAAGTQAGSRAPSAAGLDLACTYPLTTKLGPETQVMANVDGIMETATSKQRRRNDWRFWDGGGFGVTWFLMMEQNDWTDRRK